MSKKRTPTTPPDDTDDEFETDLADLGGIDPEPEPEPELEPEPEEDESPPISAAPAMEGWVPVDQHNRLREQVDQQARTLNELMGRLTPAVAPAAPTYVRPGDPKDVSSWRGFVGETVDPVVDAKVRAIVGPIQQQMAQMGIQQDEATARAALASAGLTDFDTYAADIATLRQAWFAESGKIAPAIALYHTAKGVRQMQARATTRPSAPVKRATAGATATVGSPAAAPRPKISAPKTLADVAKMDIKQMEAALANTRL